MDSANAGISKKDKSAAIIIFGASGDLTKRKLLPTLFRLKREQVLSDDFYIMGAARTDMSDDDFRETVRKSLEDVHADGRLKEFFIERCFYTPVDYADSASYARTAKRIEELDGKFLRSRSHVYHLATPPLLFDKITAGLHAFGLTQRYDNLDNFNRIIYEKPFGSSLDTAKGLDETLHKMLDEDQIYRIDHYLGKETVQNILVLRFANVTFEPIWNRQYIDNVQISVAEEVGVGSRGGYFDKIGLLRDMVQNHMLQLLALIAMEAPISFDADRVRDEKVKLMRAIRPFPLDEPDGHIIRAQYSGAEKDGKYYKGYLEEEKVNPQSQTETYVAAKLFIDNWRWQGVPFYIRSGKRLKSKVSEVAITFKRVPHCMFYQDGACSLKQSILKIRIHPDEGASFTVQAKKPGYELTTSDVDLSFSYKDRFGSSSTEAYERLIYDCLLGDQTLFWRSDGVEEAWRLFTPVLEKWESDDKGEHKVLSYPVFSRGPKEADELLKKDGRRWVDIYEG